MATENRAEGYNDGTLANFVTLRLMPEQLEVRERTERTRTIGAFMLIRHLAGGDWGTINENEGEVISEFISRVVANAERQGLVLTNPNDEVQPKSQPESSSFTLEKVGKDLGVVDPKIGGIRFK